MLIAKNIKDDGQMPFRGVEFREWWVSSLSSIMRRDLGIEWQLKQLTFRFSNIASPDSSPTQADTLGQRFHKIKRFFTALEWAARVCGKEMGFDKKIVNLNSASAT